MKIDMNRRRAVLAAVALVGGCAREDPAKQASAAAAQQAASTAPFKGADLTGASYGRGFRLTDTQGRERTLADWRGRVVVLHFGFTMCPDACPTELQRDLRIKEMLGKDADRLQVLFFTLDPERDTPQVMARYMAAFDPTFVALSTDLAHTREVADEFKVFYRKVPAGDSYSLDHSTLSFAFDREGRLRVGLRYNETAEDCAHDLRQLLA